MGNCQACLSGRSVHNSNEEEAAADEEGEMIRVMRTTDNEMFEFPGPVSVKDLLFGFQGFAVFHNNTHNSSIFNRKQQPLHPDTLLKFSHLYYLKPLLNPSLTKPLLSYDGNKSSLSSNELWIKQALIKPLGDEDTLLLGQHVIMSSAKPSINAEETSLYEDAGRLLTMEAQDQRAPDGSLPSHAHENVEVLITKNERAIDGPLEGSFPLLHNHDRAFNEVAEGLLAQEKPSSYDAPFQNSCQDILKVKKVRFSDEVRVIPSSKMLVADDGNDDDSTASTSSSISTDLGTSKEELIPQFGKANAQSDKEVGYHSPSKEELIPYLSRKEMNGVVRLKVVISKKQLTELMSSRSSNDKQSNALMEKMLAPLLSPTSSPHKSESFHGGSSSPSWKPTLDHIPEDHPCLDPLL